VNTVMNLHDPYNAGSFLTSGETISFSRRTQIHEVSQKSILMDVTASISILYFIYKPLTYVTVSFWNRIFYLIISVSNTTGDRVKHCGSILDNGRPFALSLPPH
jgi:hypothetical protein